MEISDEKLLDLYVQGDVAALDELISRYKKPLYSFLWRFTRNSLDVEELFQETWFRVIRKAANFEHSKFKGWIFTIAHNLVIDGSRARRGHLSLDQTSEYNESHETLGDSIPSTGLGPDVLTGDRELHMSITRALASLPAEQREVFVLRMEVDMSFKEIAAIQKTSTNTTLARMQYALSKMRKLLSPLYEGAERKS